MQVDLWYVRSCAADDARLRTLLDETELRQEARLTLARVRQQYVVTRALVRCVLEGYTGLPAQSFRFDTGPHGKPLLSKPATCPWQFNVSHAQGAVICAITRDIELGVDIERLDRRVNLDLAERYFAAAEVAQLRAQPESAQPRRFLEFWTLKEAFLKSLGTGLATPLSSFAFQLLGERPEVQVLDPNLGPSGHWTARQFELDGEYLGAVAVRNAAASHLELRIRLARPLEDSLRPESMSGT